MTSKQRAFLRKAANTMEPVYQIGKNGLDDKLLQGINEALTARELIKVTIHESSELTPREITECLCKALDALPVQVIGRRIVLYKKNPESGRYGI